MVVISDQICLQNFFDFNLEYSLVQYKHILKPQQYMSPIITQAQISKRSEKSGGDKTWQVVQHTLIDFLGLMLGLNVVFTKGSLTRPMLTLKFASRDGVMFEIMLSVVKEGSIVGGSKRNGG